MTKSITRLHTRPHAHARTHTHRRTRTHTQCVCEQRRLRPPQPKVATALLPAVCAAEVEASEGARGQEWLLLVAPLRAVARAYHKSSLQYYARRPFSRVFPQRGAHAHTREIFSILLSYSCLPVRRAALLSHKKRPAETR